MKMKHTIYAVLLICALAALCARPSFALYPEDKEKAQKDVAALEGTFEGLFKDFVPYFSGEKKAKLSGEEEIGWRIHDFVVDVRSLKDKLESYYENEKKIDALLDRMDDHTRWIDEAFVYTPLSETIAKDWIRAKDQYRQLAAMVRRKLTSAEIEEERGGLSFAVSKVNTVDKQFVLRELLHNFLGSSELDKFPFPEEKKRLDPQEIGEHHIVSWSARGMKRFDKPVILRFEYKFNKREFDGVSEETYRDLKGGSYSYTFKNIGADFTKRGKIVHWRASVVYDNKIVAEKQSAMWAIASR